MITYTYIVKCPECEDEFFDFFDEAKKFALGCLTNKPIITQTEVNRNDFGECTDHHDLGTVWSWEDVMTETDAEPAVSVFTKDDLKLMAAGKDPEFDSIDNSVDFEIEEVSEAPTDERKPIPEGMTIEQLVEEMEENEDTVECTWCEELFDKSECRKEVDLGWLCSRCEMAIKSRGETLTFREGSYWDFLDEKLDLDLDFSNCVDSSDMEIWGLEHTGENFYKTVLLKRFNDVSFKGPEDEAQKVYDEMYNIDGMLTFSFGKDGLPILNAWNVDLLRKLGSINIEFEDTRYEDAAAAAWGKTPVRENVEELHDLGNEYDGGYPTEKPELSEIDEVSDSHLALCPECGKDSFDTETGICVECGFN